MGIGKTQNPREDTMENRYEAIEDHFGSGGSNPPPPNYKGGGQPNFLAFPDDPENPQNMTYMRADENGNAVIIQDANARAPVIRQATEEEVERAVNWSQTSQDKIKRYERESGTEMSASAKRLFQLRPQDAMEEPRFEQYFNGRSPRTLSTN